MALLRARPRACSAATCRRRSTSRCCKNLVGRIARDEERHEEFFANLVAHCLTYDRDETVAAIATRAAAFEPIGADIDAYQDKVRVVAEAGIFDDAALRAGHLRPHHRSGVSPTHPTSRVHVASTH